MADILGFHHMTAICGPAQENLDFYGGVLGMRLVKRTVNFDDPTAYHFYYGDETGTPGTLLTFFPYPNGYPGRPGRGQLTVTTLAIAKEAVPFWVDRFRQNDVEYDKPHSRDGAQYIGFRAPDGLCLELEATEGVQGKRIGPIKGVTLMVEKLGGTADVLTELLGFEMSSSRDHRHRFINSLGHYVQVLEDSGGLPSRSGHGSVHHIAFRVPGEQEQAVMRETLLSRGYNVSGIMDRTYFKSIYFREPGGILFEIATDGPGFAVDEDPGSLGESLKLPIQYEPIRFKIERLLPAIEVPRR